MEKRNFILIIFLTLSLVLASLGVSFADPSSVIVVRDSSSNLWAKTCSGLSCSEWTLITGRFSVQPTLTWDEDIQRYLLVGVGLDGQVWRSTFDRLGNHDGVWVAVGGSTPSPVAVAGGGIMNNFVGSDQTGSIELTGTISNIKSVNVTTPWDGFVVCNASGQIVHNRSSASGNDFARIYITTTSGGTGASYTATDVPSGTPTGPTSFPYAFQRWFSVSPGSINIYVTGEEGGSAAATTTTTVYDTMLLCVYQPYSY